MDRRSIFQGFLNGIAAAFGLKAANILPQPSSSPTTIHPGELRRTEFFSMLDEIREYVRETGDTILSTDDKLNLLVGFRALNSDTGKTGPLWTIHVWDLKQSVLKTPKKDHIRVLLETERGRARIAASLSPASWVKQAALRKTEEA